MRTGQTVRVRGEGEAFSGCSINSVVPENTVYSTTAWHVIPLNNIEDFGYDTDGYADIANGRFLVPSGLGGIYEVIGFVVWAGNAINAANPFVVYLDLCHSVQGELAVSLEYMPAGTYNLQMSNLVRWSGVLAGGDAFTLRVRHTSGKNVGFDPEEWNVGLSAKLLRRT